MIKLDSRNLFSEKIQNKITNEQYEKLKPQLVKAKEKFLSEELGFKKLPYQYFELKKDLEKVDPIAKDFEDIVIIGIGGSDLGTRAVHRAINHAFYNISHPVRNGHKLRLFFAGDTTDPELISDLINVLNLSKTLFFVVSKSGNTIEQASTFVFFREMLKKFYDIDDNEDDAIVNKHFIFLTDPKTGTLRELANAKGYQTFDVPSDVGGRFSVLSSVGAIPAYLTGVNIEKLLEGAKDMHEHVKNEKNDVALEYVAAKYLYYKNGKTNSIMMPYQYSLYEFGKWYQQLWAESLGKKVNSSGKEVFEGQTPAAVLGPVDQHSQLQLYNEGPNDKFFTFITAENSRNNLKLPKNYKNIEAFEYLSGHNFQEILNLEHATTAFALTQNGRPNCTITVPEVDEYHLGQLFYFFEVAVTYFGYLLDINPFDQPGVELSKNAMFGVLGKKGYEKEKEDFEEYNAG